MASVPLAGEGGGEGLGGLRVELGTELGDALVHLGVETLALAAGGQGHALRAAAAPIRRARRGVQVVQQGGRSEDGVAGEGQLLFHGEHPSGEFAGPGARLQEDRLELAQLAGQAQHGRARKAAGVGEDRQAIACQYAFGEYIDLPVIHFRLRECTRPPLGRPRWERGAQCAGYSASTLSPPWAETPITW